MLDWLRKIRDVVFAIWTAMLFNLRTLGLVVMATWPFILLCVAFIVGIGPHVNTLLNVIENHMVAATGAMWGGITGAQDAVSAGWPPQLAAGVGYLNRYFPLDLVMSSFLTLCFLWVFCTLIRIAKSFIPTIN